MPKLSDHRFTTMTPTFPFDEVDPFYEDGRLSDADASATGPAGLRPQAASRLDQRRSSHGAGDRQ